MGGKCGKKIEKSGWQVFPRLRWQQFELLIRWAAAQVEQRGRVLWHGSRPARAGGQLLGGKICGGPQNVADFGPAGTKSHVRNPAQERLMFPSLSRRALYHR